MDALNQPSPAQLSLSLAQSGVWRSGEESSPGGSPLCCLPPQVSVVLTGLIRDAASGFSVPG